MLPFPLLLNFFNEFLKSLVNILTSLRSDEKLKEGVLDMVIKFVKFANGCTFHFALYHKLLQRIVTILLLFGGSIGIEVFQVRESEKPRSKIGIARRVEGLSPNLIGSESLDEEIYDEGEGTL
ncbi:hypothetical protein Fmac_018082 [Flemingia macrophylla]|uniref:Uncharacterized protein n=1 Tax=Flemingia macrophylla TaxID=520843 RepID=A0ABD1M421_9FABA